MICDSSAVSVEGVGISSQLRPVVAAPTKRCLDSSLQETLGTLILSHTVTLHLCFSPALTLASELALSDGAACHWLYSCEAFISVISN